MNPKKYYERDPLSFCEGAFKGLTQMLPRGVRVVRSGGTFAVSSSFPWLIFAHSLNEIEQKYRVNKSDWLYSIYEDAKSRFARAPKTSTLYLPAPSAAGVSSINAAAGVGGGVHEAGHIICDVAMSQFPSFKEFEEKLGAHLVFNIEYHKCDMAKWVNVCADMRLEPGMSMLFPETEHRFFAVQSWVHELERPGRGKQVPSDFLMALRDAGKGWISEDSKKVYAEYSQEARDLVDLLKPIWSSLRPKNTNWVESAHQPVYAAIEIINALSQLLKEPKNPKGGGKGQGQGDEQGEQGGEQGEQEQGQGDEQDGKSQGNEKGNSPIDLDDIRKLLDGQGDAPLDPSSAMKKEVSENSEKLDHELYIPNGAEVIYRKLL